MGWLDDDLAAFFEVSDFAVPVLRVRTATANLAFNAISGMREGDALQGYASFPENSLLCPVADVIADDELRILAAPGGAVLATYRVKRVLTVNDGRELLAYLEPGSS